MLGVLNSKIYGNGIGTWGLAVLLTATILVVALLAKILLLRRLPEQAPGEDLRWRAVVRELIEKTSSIFLVIAAVYAGMSILMLERSYQSFIFSVFVVALFIQCALWADRIVAALLVWRLAPRRAKAPMRNALSLIQFLVRVCVWSLALLLIFENLGFDVTALVAGLGIGGIAVALAAQSVLSDLFSSLAIVLDRPFEVGDFIVFGDQNGTVEKIGIKTTRLRSLSGEQIVCANSDLLNSRIHNYKRMAERRVVFSLTPTYDTPVAKLERIPSLVQAIVEGQDLTRFERAHFNAFGESALLFEVVYWVLSPDHNTYTDIHQAISFAVLRTFQREGIEFAFPTQTLHLPDLKAALPVSSTPALQRLRASAAGG
jgi:small-conductance mechanosensitive channel